MRSSFTYTFELFFNPRTIPLFLLGSVAIGVASNATYQVCVNIFGTATPAALGIGLSALLILIVSVMLVYLVLWRKLAQVPQPEYRTPAARRGLIYLVSQPEPCLTAVRHHAAVIERLWLVCSTKTAEMAEKLKRDVQQIVARLGNDCVQLCPVHDVNDPLEFFRLVEGIHQNLPAGWSSDQVIADYLGMTSNSSVGMALACVLHGWPLEYTQPRFDENRQPLEPLPPREIVLRLVARPKKV